MFGNTHKQNEGDNQLGSPVIDPAAMAAAHDQSVQTDQPVTPAEELTAAPAPQVFPPQTNDDPAPADNSQADQSAVDIADQLLVDDVPKPSNQDKPVMSAPAPDVAADESASADVPGDLMNIKQEALNHLSPLVSHLDQSPEEKFKTTMMMIQASDNQELVKEAYAAAKDIPDDKTRAQALLDIVNEINYFTQHHNAKSK